MNGHDGESLGGYLLAALFVGVVTLGTLRVTGVFNNVAEEPEKPTASFVIHKNSPAGMGSRL
ncbi:MAG: hypothetical protein ACOYK8_04435 [Alphaproteobacteria bacterium]